MNLKKAILSLLFLSVSITIFSQVATPTPASATDTACHGDTAFAQILIYNNGNVDLVIDSIVAPAGFGRKGTYPATISVVSTYPNNFASIDFYHQGSTLGLYSDTFLVYSNAANVPRPFKIPASMRIVPKAVVSVAVNDTDQCRNANLFTFTNTSTISSGTITSYDWFFGDAGSSTATSPSKTYTTSDTFDVLMIATSNLGCETYYQRKMIVFPTVSTLISPSSTFACFKNNSFTFTDGSTISSGNYNVKWYFGDGDSSTQSNPVHSYAKDSSSFKLRLVATSGKGCVSRDSADIFVYPTPVPKFTINDSDQCLNVNSFVFTSASTVKSGGLTYDWNFGDLSTSSATNPTKTYSTSGNRNVRMIVTSDLNCSDTLIKPVIIYKKPTVGFTISDSVQCLANNYFSFTNTSSIGAPDTLFYSWTFGDGNGSIDTSVGYQYTVDGNYTVKLLTTSNFGCKDSVTHTTTIYPNPDASFITNDTAQCLNNQGFSFVNLTTISSGTIAGYSWRFGDGDTSNLSAPSKNDYPSPDTLTVLLIARSSQTCYDTARQEVIIFPVPNAQHQIADTALCFNGHQFVLTDNSTINYGTLTHKWQFGDGGTSNQADTVYSYSSIATYYPISHTVTSDQGCGATKLDSLYLYPNPVAGFSVSDSTQCLRGNSFTFLNSSTISMGTVTSFWKFGNTDTSSMGSPNYVYNYSDTFNVVLMATSDKGCKDSALANAIVYPHPNAKFKVNNNEQCFTGHQFDFRDTSTISYGTMTYYWDFGDATNATTSTFTKFYTTADTFDITYTVTSDQGCDSTVTSKVYVDPSPVAAFTANDSTQCINGNQFIFTNNSTVSGGNMFYFWDFGNGSNSTTANGGAIYISTGNPVVRLQVRTDKNCIDSTKQTMHVYPKPVATFAVNNPIQCFDGNSFSFTNNSNISSGTLTYDWAFGDGTTSTQTDFVHSYITPDTFIVRLKATSTDGCLDSIQRNVYVNPVPVVDFTVDDSTQCINGNLFTFTDNSSIASGSMNYQWNFGDFTADLSPTPAPKDYASADTFLVSLIITSDNNCSDTFERTVYVFDTPDPTFSGLNKQYCVNSPIVTLTPKVPGGTFSGDNITGSDFTPSFIGWNVITYAIEVADGCADTATDSTLVVPPPSFDLGLDTILCAEDFFTLNVTTLGATYLWSDNSKESFYRVHSAGTHTVSVTNACGTVSDSVTVKFLDFPCDAFIPNAFTPEGNTVNDYFKPDIDTTIVKGMVFIVFGRWGTKIFETTDLKTLGWDGMQNGVPAPEGVYGYLLSMTLQREDVRILKSVKGSFHLLR